MLSDASLSTPAARSYGIGAAACAYMGLTAALVKMGQLEGWKGARGWPWLLWSGGQGAPVAGVEWNLLGFPDIISLPPPLRI